MKPVQLQVLLHYYAFCSDYNNGDYSPAVRQAIDFLVQQGMIYPSQSRGLDDPYYKVSERGQVFVKAMCDLPLPVQTWTMPKGE